MPLWWRILRNTLFVVGVTIAGLYVMLMGAVHFIDAFDRSCTIADRTHCPEE